MGLSWRIVALTAWCGAFLLGCAAHSLPMPHVDGQAIRMAEGELRYASLPAPMRLSPSEWVPALERVRQRMWPAGLTVCRETFTHGCPESLKSMRPVVLTDVADINAYADDQSGQLLFTAGLMRQIGNDDEIAMVMGHEMAHIMFGHNQKTRDNADMGAALGLLIGLGASAEYAPYLSATEMTNLMQLSMQGFQHLGSLSYSKEMELEADALSAHIVDEAGYNFQAAKGFLVRMHRKAAEVGPQQAKSMVGFLSTHPSNARRLAHWDIAAGKAVLGMTPRM